MSDFGTRIRESLRRASPIPVSAVPLGPVDRAARPGPQPAAPTVRRWLAAAVGIIVAAGIGLAASGCSTPVSDAPAAPPGRTTVIVDLYSGRENPQLPLDPDVAEEMYLMIGDSAAAGEVIPADPPDPGPGFRGFVVTPADANLPVLRILPTAVYLDESGTPGRVDDPGSGFYNRVYDAIRPLLDDATRTALPDSNPAIPEVTATIPPQVGAAATWTLADSERVTATSTTVTIEVTRAECSSGVTGAIAQAVVSLGIDDIIIRVDAEPLPGNEPQNCQGNDSVQMTVSLHEPIGDRALVDAACLEGPAVRTSFCETGATRWSP